MSNVKKPELVAIIYSSYELRFAGSGSLMEILKKSHARVGSVLVTEDQSEAYAAERVREAFEQAAQEADDWAMQYVEVDSAPHRIGDSIRALITKE